MVENLNGYSSSVFTRENFSLLPVPKSDYLGQLIVTPEMVAKVVPGEWKEANIIPLFKKVSRSKSENYRPVSLTSVICKLLERLIKDRHGAINLNS